MRHRFVIGRVLVRKIPVFMSSFLKILSKVATINPLFFMAFYVAAIPGFGFIYTFGTPNGFYSSYAKFEPSEENDAFRLESTLEDAIRKQKVSQKDKTLDQIVWFDEIMILGIEQPDPSHISLFIRYDGEKVSFSNDADFYCKAQVIVDVSAPLVLTYNGETQDYTYPVEPTSQCSSSGLNEEFSTFYFNDGLLHLTSNQNAQLQTFLYGLDGNASDISGQFWRMFYLSAVVITTLGLGDIVPISPLARTLVAFEAVTGVMLAGFFLNAVAYRASHPGSS